MRKYSSIYSVNYKLFSKQNVIRRHGADIACYAGLFGTAPQEGDYLILEKFLEESSNIYSKYYIKSLCNICNYKVEYLSEDKIKITNMKSCGFTLKLFLTLFRILWEIDSFNSEPNLIFLKDFCENTHKVRNLLPRLIICHNKSNLFMGSGHGIKSSRATILKIKTKKELHNYNPGNYGSLHTFFQ